MIDQKLIQYHNLADELDRMVMDAQEEKLDERVIHALLEAAHTCRVVKEEQLQNKAK